MKPFSSENFKKILLSLRIVTALLFFANLYFMVELYGSIKQRYVEDAEQCLRRAVQIELVDRIVSSGMGDDRQAVWLHLGLTKSNDDEEYSQGYKRVDTQMLSVITQYLLDDYSDLIPPPDPVNLENAFRKDLAYAGLTPEKVYVVIPGATLQYSGDMWELNCDYGDGEKFIALISPLTSNILHEMGGVIGSSLLIALVLTFGFWYLLHVIARQRTIEEMKDDFTNNMTHELKTPIAVAYAANDALLQYPDPSDTERTHRYLTAANEQLTRLSELVENILSMSMERRKSLTIKKEDIAVAEILRKIADRQKMKAPKPVDIEIECEGPLTLSADPVHFPNVIDNLTENAVKYSGDNVKIKICCTTDALSVSDTGIGIQERNLPHIWEKFYRVPTGNVRNANGYGIGLYYVRQIVEMHGWEITVKSKPGVGTTFTIHFK